MSDFALNREGNSIEKQKEGRMCRWHWRAQLYLDGDLRALLAAGLYLVLNGSLQVLLSILDGCKYVALLDQLDKLL